MPRRCGDGEPAHENPERPGADAKKPAPAKLLAIHIHPGAAQSGPLHPELKALLALWSRMRGDRIMPTRDDLPLQLLQPWLGHLALLEPGPGGFGIRLGGGELVARFGCEITGLTLAELPADIRKGLYAMIDLVHARRVPVVAASSVRFETRRTLYSDLLLPLSGGRFRSTLMLLGSYPVIVRPGGSVV
jgi:hypothetical protein